MVTVLENIRSVYNVGSIFRTSDGAGIKKIYLTGFTPTPLNKIGKPRKKMKKTALGATKSVKWEQMDSTDKCLEKLKKKGYKLFAIEEGQERSIDYKRVSNTKNEKIALILGNEVEGLDKKTLDKTDKILSIPMKGRKRSLNVAVAFGIIAYHFQN